MRVYVPATLALLRDYVAAGLVPASTERVVPPAEDEETEYAALMTAADLSAEAAPEDGRRVVITVETAGGPEGALEWADVVAVHADTEPFSDPDDDLAWFATQEVDDLLSGAG